MYVQYVVGAFSIGINGKSTDLYHILSEYLLCTVAALHCTPTVLKQRASHDQSVVSLLQMYNTVVVCTVHVPYIKGGSLYGLLLYSAEQIFICSNTIQAYEYVCENACQQIYGR